MEKFRDRKFNLLLYPEDLTHVTAIEKIKQSYDYALILHDKDCNEDGEIKKEHYHVVVTVGNNMKWSTALANDLGITENYIEKIRNLDRALEYLIHLNDDNKYQYSIDAVEGTLKNRIIANMNASDKTEGEKVMEMIEYIKDTERLNVTTFATHCAKNGVWDIFRRSAVIFVKIIEENRGKSDNIKNCVDVLEPY